MTLWIFWLSVGLVVYTYAGYPLLMFVLSSIRPRPVRADDIYPKVTVIISAYNEEKSIRSKLDNILAADYAGDALSIIVGSDASSDNTDSIVEAYVDDRVRLLRVEGRVGKTQVQNVCVENAGGEILIFTDATTLLKNDAIRNIVRSFADSDVAVVAGKLVYEQDVDTGTGRGGVSYWEYETALKLWESRYYSLIGVSGCFYGVRKSDYREISPELISDFVVALDMAKRKRRVVLDQDAVCYESTLEKSTDELQMRVRVILRSLVAIRSRRELLNPVRYGVVSLSLWSHKVFRYLLPVFLLVPLITLPFLLQAPLYRGFFLAALIVLTLAIVGMVGGTKNKLLVVPSYLLLTNLASLIALWQFVLGKNVVVWTPKR